MTDAECVAFLRWALPRLGMRWAGFRRVRRQVCSRVSRRLRHLGLEDLDAYRALLERRPEEWQALDALCRIPISRFFRDRGVWEALAREVLPRLASGRDRLRAWSLGCASGEEPYSLAILWQTALASRFPGVTLEVLATDAEAHLLERARRGVYRASSLKELTPTLREAAFEPEDDAFRLRPTMRGGVSFRCQDVRHTRPEGRFELVLCRNVAFTYFDAATQREVLAALAEHTASVGALVIGAHETLPSGPHPFEAWIARLGIYRRSPE